MLSIDFEDQDQLADYWSGKVDIKLKHSGYADAVVLFWKLEMDEGSRNIYSTAPRMTLLPLFDDTHSDSGDAADGSFRRKPNPNQSNWVDHWKQAVYPMTNSRSRPLEEGETISVSAARDCSRFIFGIKRKAEKAHGFANGRLERRRPERIWAAQSRTLEHYLRSLFVEESMDATRQNLGSGLALILGESPILGKLCAEAGAPGIIHTSSSGRECLPMALIPQLIARTKIEIAFVFPIASSPLQLGALNVLD